MYGMTQEIKAKYENLFLYHVKLLSMSSQMNGFFFWLGLSQRLIHLTLISEKIFWVFSVWYRFLTLWVDNSASSFVTPHPDQV